MEVIQNLAYPINLKVVIAEMTDDDEFTAINDHINYDQVYTDAAVLVVAHEKDAWVQHWFAVRDHDSMRTDSGLLTSAAAIRLLKLAPPHDKVARRALRLIEADYNRRANAK